MKAKTRALLFLLVAVVLPLAGAPQGQAPPVIAIVGARIWDGTGRAAVADGVVVVRGGRIEAREGRP